jgi:MFS family permease
MAVTLVAFLIIGFGLPVLPLHVHQGLGLSTFVVDLVTRSQFAASVISRVWSGQYADSRGPKRAVVAGLLTATVAGLLHLLSLGMVGVPWVAVTILLVGRALLGGAESFIITGALSWALVLVGPKRAGRVRQPRRILGSAGSGPSRTSRTPSRSRALSRSLRRQRDAIRRIICLS